LFEVGFVLGGAKLFFPETAGALAFAVVGGALEGVVDFTPQRMQVKATKMISPKWWRVLPPRRGSLILSKERRPAGKPCE
jgi:hypothetical protein